VALLIRSPREPDIRSIAELHIRSWQFGHQGLFPQSVIDSVSVEERVDSWRETLASPSPGKTVLVAEQDGEIVGFVSSGPSRDRSVEAAAGEIYELFVEPDLVATGVGAALFRESLASRGVASAPSPSGSWRGTNALGASTSDKHSMWMARPERQPWVRSMPLRSDTDHRSAEARHAWRTLQPPAVAPRRHSRDGSHDLGDDAPMTAGGECSHAAP
jgi:GNAT superfamily N-acetyltransferase